MSLAPGQPLPDVGVLIRAAHTTQQSEKQRLCEPPDVGARRRLVLHLYVDVLILLGRFTTTVEIRHLQNQHARTPHQRLVDERRYDRVARVDNFRRLVTVVDLDAASPAAIKRAAGAATI